MELLTIQHADLTMTIECGKFDAIWTKAKNNIGEQALHCVCCVSKWLKKSMSTYLAKYLKINGEVSKDKWQRMSTYFFWVFLRSKTPVRHLSLFLRCEGGN